MHAQLKGMWERASTWVSQYQKRAPPSERERLASRWEGELLKLAQHGWKDPDCQRISKRLAKHSGEFFTFVACSGVEGTNNRAERALRPYVVKRKISGGHRSWKGAGKHAILMKCASHLRSARGGLPGHDWGVLKEQLLQLGK